MQPPKLSSAADNVRVTVASKLCTAAVEGESDKVAMPRATMHLHSATVDFRMSEFRVMLRSSRCPLALFNVWIRWPSMLRHPRPARSPI